MKKLAAFIWYLNVSLLVLLGVFSTAIVFTRTIFDGIGGAPTPTLQDWFELVDFSLVISVMALYNAPLIGLPVVAFVVLTTWAGIYAD